MWNSKNVPNATPIHSKIYAINVPRKQNPHTIPSQKSETPLQDQLRSKEDSYFLKNK